jgi:glucoamylase
VWPGRARRAGSVDGWQQGRFRHLHHVGQQIWFTLGGGELTEVYYPNLGTPAVRDLQFVVTDGRSWVQRESEDTHHTLVRTDPRSLSYQQINTDSAGRYRITKTDTTDPTRSVLLMRVHFESLTKKATAAVRHV